MKANHDKRIEFLFLKLCYGDGLTPEEYKEYKERTTK